jgi:hypothetical protein
MFCGGCARSIRRMSPAAKAAAERTIPIDVIGDLLP